MAKKKKKEKKKKSSFECPPLGVKRPPPPPQPHPHPPPRRFRTGLSAPQREAELGMFWRLKESRPPLSLRPLSDFIFLSFCVSWSGEELWGPSRGKGGGENLQRAPLGTLSFAPRAPLSASPTFPAEDEARGGELDRRQMLGGPRWVQSPED
ncbi:unnamed protein product [Pipistrellus nathusii]|uniref:Uncharacterized protein n=1 Tax=Pipistrellus nathusii TaxID=59473 RepID=A0ABN9ZSZ7_PIPNA